MKDVLEQKTDSWGLKKNSWHTKLMKSIWGYNHNDFPNMCPYFWLSVFNVLLVIVGCIPYLLYRVVKPVFKVISNTISDVTSAFDEYCKNRKKNWLDNFVEKLLSDDLEAFEELSKDYKLENKIKYESKVLYYARYTDYKASELKGVLDEESINRMLVLRENFKRWDIIQEVKRKQRELLLDKKYDEARIAKEKSIERRKKIGEITVRLQFFFKAIGVAMGLGVVSFVGYFLYHLFLLLLKVNWILALKYVGIFLVVVAVVALAIGIVYLLVKAIVFLTCKYGKYCVPCELRRKKISNFFEWLFTDNLVINGLATTFISIGKGLKETGLIIKMLYKNNCPPIDWKD